MTMDENLTQILQTLMEQDSTLTERLRQASNAEAAAKLLCDGAAAQGITLPPNALDRFIQFFQPNDDSMISDAQLEAVAAGGNISYDNYRTTSQLGMVLACMQLSKDGSLITGVPNMWKDEDHPIKPFLCPYQFEDGSFGPGPR